MCPNLGRMGRVPGQLGQLSPFFTFEGFPNVMWLWDSCMKETKVPQKLIDLTNNGVCRAGCSTKLWDADILLVLTCSEINKN